MRVGGGESFACLMGRWYEVWITDSIVRLDIHVALNNETYLALMVEEMNTR